MYDEGHSHLRSARELCARQEYEAAVEEFRRFLHFRPDHANARVGLGDTFAELNRDPDAVREYREAARLAPDLVDAHLHLAEALVRLGQWDEAIRECRRVIELDSDVQRAHYALGCALGYRHEWEEAATEYRTAISLKPKDAAAVRGLAAVLFYADQLEEAEALYRQAIRMEPDCVRGHSGLAGVLLETKRFDEAIVECKEALHIDSNDYLSWFRLAEANRRLAGATGSKRFLPGQVYRCVADSTGMRDQWEAARVAYEAALRSSPAELPAMKGLARALESLGDFRGAERVMRKAVSLYPEDSESYQLLADAQMALKHWLASWRSIRRYVDLQSEQKAQTK